MAESELDKHTNLVAELTRKVDELQVKADEAEKLKDKVDECVIRTRVILMSDHSYLSYQGIATQQINYKRQKMLWKNTRRNCKKVLICANMSRYTNITPVILFPHTQDLFRLWRSKMLTLWINMLLWKKNFAKSPHSNP